MADQIAELRTTMTMLSHRLETTERQIAVLFEMKDSVLLRIVRRDLEDLKRSVVELQEHTKLPPYSDLQS